MATQVLSQHRIPLRIPFRVPLPLRKKVSYAKGMTVCIAATCQRIGGPSNIVLCCDSRLDHGAFGSTEGADKMHFAGHGWLLMLSGVWESAKELSRSIRASFRVPPTTHSEALTAAREAARTFRASAFFSRQGTEEALVTGFVQGQPIVLHLAGNMSVNAAPFGAIGEGYNIATVMMNQRNYLQSMSLDEVVYIVYEAKRCSEKAAGVGKQTTLVVQSPMSVDDAEETVNLDMFGVPGLNWLDEKYLKCWNSDFRKNVKNFPKGCFISHKGEPY
jgi:hypothetical protein